MSEEPTIINENTKDLSSSVKTKLNKGELLNKRFLVEGNIGSGGMGDVYKATDTRLERPVAIKMLNDTARLDEAFVNRFFNEAKIVSSLYLNPHVINIFDYGFTENDSPFIVMEYLEGSDLRESIIDIDIDNLPSRTWVLEVGLHVATALIDVHSKGVIHRDLKPENIFLIDAKNMDFITKVLDFGIARSEEHKLPDEYATTLGAIIGTAKYIAPEIVTGDSLTTKVDIYSLGLILYEISNGKYPYKAKTRRQYYKAHMLEELPKFNLPTGRPDYPEEFKSLVYSMVDKEPENRPDAKEVHRKLSVIYESLI